jgi:NAD+ diphosphatase
VNYCSYCGQELGAKSLLDGSEEKYCLQCDRVFFDTPSPAVIVAVINANRILLTRSVGWSHPYWGLIAGHVKTGESAEEAAIREVREEVGLELFDLRLLKTYPLKNRNLLMIGFKAQTTQIHIKKGKELEQAAWFPLTDLLPLRPSSIASQVVAASQ